MFRAIESINSKYHIISGEVLKLWDNSWDPIVNERFINIPIDPEDFPNGKVRFYKEKNKRGREKMGVLKKKDRILEKYTIFL